MSHDLLFVDDDPLFLSRCKDIFADSPYSLHFVASGSQGLELLREGLKPAVVIAGQGMVAMDGPEFLRQAHEINPVTQLIMVAGRCDSALVAKAVNHSGLFRYYAKDVESDELKKGVIAAVSHYLHLKQSLEAAENIVRMNDELEDLTYHLEKTVDYHTRKLRKSYDENVALTHALKRKVRELEGRDRVLRHLLTIHNLEDTLQTILEVIDTVLAMSCGVVHVKDENDVLQPICSFSREIQNSSVDQSSSFVLDVVADGRMAVKYEPHAGYVAVAVPIVKSDAVLGAIEVIWENKTGEVVLSEEEVMENSKYIETFTIHAAIALGDHKISTDKTDWSKTLDDVLMDFME
jgi:DNA-binding NarL/FixJ family response regulator